MGLVFLIFVTFAAMFLQNPPQEKDYKSFTADIRTSVRLKDRNFRGLLCGMFPCLCIGLMTIGNIKPFSLSLNLSLIVTATAVSILAFSNAIGRIGWGIIGGFLKRKKAILLWLISTAIVCLAAPFAVKDELIFFLFVVFAGFIAPPLAFISIFIFYLSTGKTRKGINNQVFVAPTSQSFLDLKQLRNTD